MSLITRGFGDDIGEIQMIEELSLEISEEELAIDITQVDLNLEIEDTIIEVEVKDGEDITILHEV